MSEAPKDLEEIDEHLWIRRTPPGSPSASSDCEGPDYLVGNCHTFAGRMSAYCPSRAIYYCVSLSEIEEMSPEAERWVAGFLAGNQPRSDDMFGPGIYDAPDSDSRWHRWREALVEFRNAGEWQHAGWEHLLPFPPGMTLPSFVWTHRGDEVWTWDGEAWVRADPQPILIDNYLEGTVCVERGHCDSVVVTTVHAVCDDCGETSQTVPGSFTLEEWESAQYTYQPAPT